MACFVLLLIIVGQRSQRVELMIHDQVRGVEKFALPVQGAA